MGKEGVLIRDGEHGFFRGKRQNEKGRHCAGLFRLDQYPILIFSIFFL